MLYKVVTEQWCVCYAMQTTNEVCLFGTCFYKSGYFRLSAQSVWYNAQTMHVIV